MNEVILVDTNDTPVGRMDKIEAHRKALLHRAFSVFIFNSKGEMLLQQRSDKKYHSGGLWTNACCSHPAPGEDTLIAASRRLKEELGFTTPLAKAFTFSYRTDFENGLTENEFDHVFVGEYDGGIAINREEVMDFCYQEMPQLRAQMELHPEHYTAWFCIAFQKIEKWWKERFQKSISQ